MDISAHATTAEKALIDFKHAVISGSGSEILNRDEWRKNLSHCEILEGRVRLSLASYRLETRSLVGRDLDEHRASATQLQRDFDQYRRQLDWMRCDSRASESETTVATSDEEVTLHPMTLDQAVLTAARTQDASAASLTRTQKMALEAEQVGISILEKISEQDEHVDRIQKEVDDIKANASKSKALLRKIKWGSLGRLVGRDRRHKSRRVETPDGDLVSGEVEKSTTTRDSHKPEIKDEFMRTKHRMYELLQLVRSGTNEYKQIVANKGTCYDSVRKATELRQLFHELRVLLPQLREAQKKTRGSWLPGAISGEEQQSRYEDIRLLKRQLQDAEEDFAAGSVPSDTSLEDFGVSTSKSWSSSSQASSSQSRPHAKPASEKMTREEECALREMQDRDRQLDKQLDSIQDTVVRLGDLSEAMNAASKKQQSKIETLSQQVSSVDHNISDLSRDVGRMIKK